MNYTCLIRSVFEILALLGVTNTSTAPPTHVPFSPAPYLGAE